MKQCWAESYGQCGKKMTGEHLISNAILEKKIVVQGFSWCKEKPKEIGSASLVSNFLCDIHNGALSPYDSEIRNFLSSIENFIRNEKKFSVHGFSLKKVPVIFNVNGVLLEKWFVKTLINIALTNNKETLIHYDKILPFLFSNSPFEKPYGISFAIKVNQKIEFKDKITVVPLYNDINGTSELAGGLFNFKGYRIITLVPCSKHPIQENKLSLPGAPTDFDDLQLNWHNEEISMNMTRGRKSIKVLSLKINW